MIHGFVTSAGVIDQGKQAIRDASAALREYFDSFWGHALASFRAAAEEQPPEPRRQA